jgi:UDP-N-acetylglucosamine 2-epimerase (non-hydrolysing)
MKPLVVCVVIGTRPEAIKLAPVVSAARARPEAFSVSVVRTGQHGALVDQLMREFDLPVEADLHIMRPDQDLAHVMAESVRGLSALFERLRPDWVLVQGDTTSTFAGALAAFYQSIRIGHVEAGLRTGNRRSPFPEEANRALTARLADLHFAPTEQARRNLLREGLDDDAIVVTGNTVIDALQLALAADVGEAAPPVAKPPYVLATVHRRESHGPALARICDGLAMLLERRPELAAWLPMHPSPRVRRVLSQRLGSHPRVHLTEPLGYKAFVRALAGAVLVLTDSGGIQEECAALGKPVLVLRDHTERGEAVDAGVARLVGTQADRIAETAAGLLENAERYRAMAQPSAAFGAGTAAHAILEALLHRTRAKAGAPG